jgi:hypothetical protein
MSIARRLLAAIAWRVYAWADPPNDFPPPLNPAAPSAGDTPCAGPIHAERPATAGPSSYALEVEQLRRDVHLSDEFIAAGLRNVELLGALADGSRPFPRGNVISIYTAGSRRRRGSPCSRRS